MIFPAINHHLVRGFSMAMLNNQMVAQTPMKLPYFEDINIHEPVMTSYDFFDAPPPVHRCLGFQREETPGCQEINLYNLIQHNI